MSSTSNADLREAADKDDDFLLFVLTKIEELEARLAYLEKRTG